MALGVTGTGPYGEIRYLADTLKMDKEHLANAPLSAAAKRRLEQRIASFQARLKEARAALRASKKNQKASKP